MTKTKQVWHLYANDMNTLKEVATIFYRSHIQLGKPRTRNSSLND